MLFIMTALFGDILTTILYMMTVERVSVVVKPQQKKDLTQVWDILMVRLPYVAGMVFMLVI
jgi:hypothetical protein